MSQHRKTTARKIIFNAKEAGDVLKALRDTAIKEGVLKDPAGKDATDEFFPWWSPALSFAWDAPRKADKGIYVSVTYTGPDGVSGRLCVRSHDELVTGQIMPATDAGVAELAGSSKYPTNIEKRNKKPSVQIQKYSCQVKTAEDGITPLTDDSGQTILPGDEYLSPFYKLAELVNEAFVAETQCRLYRGMTLMMKVAEMKRANKAVTAQEIEDAFVSVVGHRNSGSMILTPDNVSSLRRTFPAEKDFDLLMKGAIIHSNLKIANLVQTEISSQAKKNPGRLLPNPITRFNLAFLGVGGISGDAKTKFYDKDAPYTGDGKQRYEVGKVNGVPVDGDNVHQFVRSRCIVDFIVEMDCACLHPMGISMPVKAEVLVVSSPPNSQALDLADVYEDDYDEVTKPAAAGPSAAKPSLPMPSKQDNYDGLLDELAGLGGDQAA